MHFKRDESNITMKTLILVRHGHALSCWDAKVSSDRLRPLSQEGQEKIRQSAQKIAKQKVHPQVIFTSPLVRAVQTADILSTVLKAPVEPENILNGFASEQEVCDFLVSQLETYDTILAVGHNPNITYAAHLLFKEVRPFAPGSFAVVDMTDATRPQLIYFGE